MIQSKLYNIWSIVIKFVVLCTLKWWLFFLKPFKIMLNSKKGQTKSNNINLINAKVSGPEKVEGGYGTRYNKIKLFSEMCRDKLESRAKGNRISDLQYVREFESAMIIVFYSLTNKYFDFSDIRSTEHH